MSNLGLGLGTSTVDAAHRLLNIACGSKCPVTGGQPLRITRHAWDKLCAGKRKKGVEYGISHFGNARFHRAYNRCRTCKGKDIPAEVQFIDIAEVRAIGAAIDSRRRQHAAPATKIQPDRKEIPMPSIAKIGVCDICDQKTTVTPTENGGYRCQMCRKICANVKNRPKTVANAIAIMGKQAEIILALGDRLPEQMQVALAKEPLESIAELVGYVGEDDEGLVSMIEQMVAENHRGRQVADPAPAMCSAKYVEQLDFDGLAYHLSQQIGRRESALWELVESFVQLVEDREEVFAQYNRLHTAMADERDAHINHRIELHKALTGNENLPIPSDAKLVEMVAHGEAMLEWISRATGQLVGLRLDAPSAVRFIELQADAKNEHSRFMVALREALGMPVCPVEELLATVRRDRTLLEEYRSTVNGTSCDVSMALERQEEAEQKLLADEQVFERIREVLGNDSLQPGDIPTAIAALPKAALADPSCSLCGDRAAIDQLIGLLGLDDGANHLEVVDAVRQLLDEPATSRHHACLDTALLNLWIDHPGIEVARIAEIRRAA